MGFQKLVSAFEDVDFQRIENAVEGHDLVEFEERIRARRSDCSPTYWYRVVSKFIHSGSLALFASVGSAKNSARREVVTHGCTEIGDEQEEPLDVQCGEEPVDRLVSSLVVTGLHVSSLHTGYHGYSGYRFR
jgi:hypothetical protein